MAAIVPRRVREMTPDWFDEVLVESGVAAPAVTDLQVEMISLGTGFAGRALRLSIDYVADSGDAPRTLIAKMPSSDASMRAVMRRMRGYEVEGRFYGELAATTPTPTPFCLWNGADVESGDFCLLIEDLVGYEIGGQTGDDIDADKVTRLVIEAARFHRRWWNEGELLSAAWLPDPYGPEIQVFQQIAIDAWALWRDEYGAAFSNETTEGIRDALKVMPDLANRAASGATTLVHGDYRLDNAMFNPGNLERPLVVIDWQLTRRGSGAYDLAYLLSQSVPTALRREHEGEWFRIYLEELGRADYQQDRLRSDFATGLLQAMVIPLAGVGITAGIREMVAAMPASDAKTGYEQAIDASFTLAQVMTDRAVAAVQDHEALKQLE